MDTKNQTIPSPADCLKEAGETKELRLKKAVFSDIPGLLKDFFKSGRVYLVADENTWKAAGQKTEDAVREAGIPIAGRRIFPGEPRLHAHYTHVKELIELFKSLPDYPSCTPIAVGGGTINDLVKRATFELAMPYLCVPTAASVDGYTANGAALLMDGFKQTLPCTAPRVIAADTDVLAQAPAYLSSSGFGDLAGKIIAGTDWIIAEKAGSAGAPAATPIDPLAWNMIQPGLMDNLNQSVHAADGDSEAVRTLFNSLAVTGFAMQYMKNSRPVSGSEHLFSHVWEMEDLSLNGAPVTHGHKVTIGTLSATAFTELFFADPSGPPTAVSGWQRPSPAEREAETAAAFRETPGCKAVVKTALEKMVDSKTASDINTLCRDSWHEIREKVLERLLPYAELKALLAKARCPLVPEAIGLRRKDIIATARKAQMMRNKYGILDLAWDMGNFESILAKLEASEVYLR
ncbi:MAG: sn-glycerol-1-phosphate dehydrogenase [Treponema sp.]|jgi:glycerol-1-phosphate dehydrogenase [NAD(P)+]|nr:sn-glycerol-1-phosphate dehydrogenase [Treponema sp.]